jgi:hypothetical protein
MKTFTTAYVKTINGIPFYFVKTYHTFPEYQNVPPILETYGMHTNFKKACKIAQVSDLGIQQQLLNKIEENASACKVIPLQPAVTKVYNLKRRHTYFPSLLRLIGLG